MKNLFVLFNHRLTALQIQDAELSLGVGEIIEPPAKLRRLWARVPADKGSLVTCPVIVCVKEWLSKNSTPGDYVLIQGEFGATYLMVRFALHLGLTPIYSTTKRQAVEEHGEKGEVIIRHHFRHIRFRHYQGE